MRSRLLSIELQGYKTFANKFRFDFPGEITCVVGPNGSGKSNIADSIRWVLGEQSFNLLRARKTEDMIFSGSSHRPRAGMAAVTIVFNNEDGWFPLDFSEVSITRRAYRDGQNEYLLNNQKVRLKEISELLAQSGVTPRTYTIIGQGLVDAALSLRPDERRLFFEEAAGISLHRKRREEAINRLDQTHRNLDRVLDILSELKPRLNSLEKQAGRAIEQERIKADLRLLMKDWYGFHWHRAQDELQRSREILRSQEERLGKLKLQKEAGDRDSQALRSELQKMRRETGSWHAQSSDIHRQLESVNRNIAVIEERIRSLQEQTEFLDTDLARLEEEAAASQVRLEKENEDRVVGNNEREEVRQLLKKSELKYRQLVEEKNTLLKEKEAAEKEYNRIETERIRLEVQIQEMLAQHETLEKQKSHLLEEQNKNKEMLVARRKAMDVVDNDFNALTEEFNTLEEEIKAVSDQIASKKADLEKIDEKRYSLEKEKSKLSTQKEIYESSIRSNDYLGEDAQKNLRSLKKEFGNQAISLVMNSFSVLQGYEKAIAAGLEEYLDGFILSQEADLVKALAHIQNNKIGRVVLFPHTTQRYMEPQQSAISSDVKYKIALQCVQFNPSAITPIIEMLMKDIMIVEDRPAALALIDRISKYQTIVTRSGEVFRGNRAVISGETRREGIFVAQHKIKELEDVLGRLEADLRVQKEIGQQLSGEIEKFSKQKNQLDQSIGLLREKRAHAANEKNSVMLQLAQAEKQDQYILSQFANIARQTEEYKEKIRLGKERLSGLIASSKEAYQVLQKRMRTHMALSEEELQQEVNHWRTKLAVMEQAVLDFDRRIAAEEKRLQGILSQKESIKERITTVHHETLDLGLRRERADGHVVEHKSGLKELNALIEPAEKHAVQLEGKIRKVDEEQSILQQKLTVAERYVTQAQLDLSRRNDELEKLREKIEDDFGLVHFEYKTEITGPTPLPLDGLVNDLPLVTEISSDVEETIKRQKAQLRRIGPINPDARAEYEAVKERYEHLSSQLADLEQADKDLKEIIRELDVLMKTEFQATFKLVANEFRQMFTRLFGGGSARLILLDEENPTEAGIEIEATLPGRRKQGLAVLSGGERSLTAVALIFSLLKVSPTPFCVLDEVDAALDEANVGRFGDLLRELSGETQFVVITHNRNTVQLADVIYGVTMARDSSSQVISLKMDEVSENLVS